MASFSRRYEKGAHEAVWEELNLAWTSFGDRSSPSEETTTPAIDLEDAEDVMRQTFERVARNTDRLIERLRDTGYRFECEASRFGPSHPPRRPANLDAANKWLEAQFGAHPIHGRALCQMPLALQRCADIAGSIDLTQEYPDQPDLYGSDDMPDLSDTLGLFIDDDSLAEMDRILGDTRAPKPFENTAHQPQSAYEDQTRHPSENDPVLARLGDWDPLQIDFAYLESDLTDPDSEQEIDNEMVWNAEFAASFEHKADVSGAINPWLAFPQTALDPIVNAEGHALTFTNYLRHAFRNGGFLGIPRRVHAGQQLENEIAPGLYLPKHEIFQKLADGLEPF